MENNNEKVTFDDNQQAAIVALLLEMVNADGVIDFGELVHVNDMLHRLGVDDDTFELGRHLKCAYALQIARNMTDAQKICLAKLLVEVIDADDQVAPQELHMLKTIADIIGLTQILNQSPKH